jgi:5-methylcytosine-specific restriction enzyme subunit McrC
MVVDAKYKTIYQNHYDKENIRQLSGYARMKPVYDKLGKNYNENIDCLIIYPDQSSLQKDLRNTDLKGTPIKEFVNFFKAPIVLPIIKEKK